MRFDDTYRHIMESAGDLLSALKSMEKVDASRNMDEEAAAFIELSEHKETFDKFKKRLQEELDKVKPKDKRLANATFEFVSELVEADGETAVMQVWRRWPDVINVNVAPFLMICDGDFSDDSFEEAIAGYIYDAETGEHVVQHECAHIIDFKSNRARSGEHDDEFERIRKRLDSIPPHLDD